MTDTKRRDTVSLAAWDVPMPVIAGETFAIKVGAKSAAGQSLAGAGIEISQAGGTPVAAGRLGETPWPGTEALYWSVVEMPAPSEPQVADFVVRFIERQEDDTAASRFSVVAAAKPVHTLTIKITERSSAALLEGVEIRLGPFHARTDANGRAELRICKGAYQLQLWRNAHIAPNKPIEITGDASIELTMAHVPEEHPDARWVR